MNIAVLSAGRGGAIGRACPRWTSQDTLRIVGAAVTASEPQVCVIDSSTSLSRRVRRACANGTDRATALFTAWIRTTSQRCSAIVAELRSQTLGGGVEFGVVYTFDCLAR